jgi:hypothetical protein
LLKSAGVHSNTSTLCIKPVVKLAVGKRGLRDIEALLGSDRESKTSFESAFGVYKRSILESLVAGTRNLWKKRSALTRLHARVLFVYNIETPFAFNQHTISVTYFRGFQRAKCFHKKGKTE